MRKQVIYLFTILCLLFSGCEMSTGDFSEAGQANLLASINGENIINANGSNDSIIVITPEITEMESSQVKEGSVSIKATRAEPMESGKARLYWDASGDFPEGFAVAWSKDSTTPVYPGDTWITTTDRAARSMDILGNPGDAYYFRICKLLQGACVFYSPTVKYTFETPQQTATLPVSGDLSLKITSVQSDGYGNVNIYWTAIGSFPNGFKVVWSDTTSEPIYPGNSNQYINSPTASYAQVSGITGGKVTFRVCRFDGNQCDFYSDPYTFTLTSTPVPEAAKYIQITNITNDGTGRADVVWSAVGYFPKGFKVVWSADTKKPVFPGNDYVYLSSPTARIADVTGDAGRKYYFRVCEYLGDKCGVYSNTYEFTYKDKPETATQDTSTITINDVEEIEPGLVYIGWTVTGSFPNGFKVVWSDSNPTPTYPSSYSKLFKNPITRAVGMIGTTGERVYLRVCKVVSGGCGVYSNTVSFVFVGTYVEDTATPSSSTSTPVTPAATTAVPPVATTAVSPVVTTAVPPVATTAVPPVATTAVPPAATTEVPPAATTEVPPAATTEVPPSVTTEVPTVAST